MIKIKKIWADNEAVWIETTEGDKACEYFKDYQRLKFATEEQRKNFETDDFGIHWPDIDEDLSFEGFFEKKEPQDTFLHHTFMQHPEINASAIARRLGIKQSLLAAYISGSKNPSHLRLMEIVGCLNELGKELQNITLPEESGNKVADEG